MTGLVALQPAAAASGAVVTTAASGAASESVTAWLQGIGGAAQAVIAIVALYFAYKSFTATTQASKDSIFIGSTVTSLLGVVAKAREVKAAYRAMFRKHDTVAAKKTARAKWLAVREDVATILADLSELLPEVKPARERWEHVEREEDTFATSDQLPLPPAESINGAYSRYETQHQEFLKVAGQILRQLR